MYSYEKDGLVSSLIFMPQLETKTEKINSSKPLVSSSQTPPPPFFFNQLVVLASQWTPPAFLQCKTTSKLVCPEFPPRNQVGKEPYLEERVSNLLKMAP